MHNEIYTTCARDCWDGCGIIAKVEKQRIIDLRGAPHHPFTKGFLCSKMRKGYLKHIYSEERVLYPMIKINGTWKKISWDKALEIAAQKITFFISKYSPLSILFYPGFGNMGIVTRFTSNRFFNLLGGVTTVSGSLCDSAGEEGLKKSFGQHKSHDPEDIVNSSTIIIWGRNPAVTNIHLMPYIKVAKKRGAKIIVVDPIKTKTVQVADLHLAPSPGSDGFLALGIAKILHKEDLIDRAFIQEKTYGFEEFLDILNSFKLEKLADLCRIDQNLIRKTALIYGKIRPSSIWLGMGAQHYRAGAETFRAISALAALTGQIGIPGGGVSFEFPTASHFDQDICATRYVKEQRLIPRPLLGEYIERFQKENPPVKMAWVVAANPVNQSPNSLRVRDAFRKINFVIVQDAFITDTVDCAHLFLPAALFLEQEDITAGFGHCWIGPVHQVVPPPGEAKSDLEIFQLIASKLGFGEKMEGSPKKWIDLATRSLQKAGLTLEKLLNEPCRDPRIPAVPFEDRQFQTPSGKYEFISDFSIFKSLMINQKLKNENAKTFRLITPKPYNIILSEALKQEQKTPPTVKINSEMACSLGLNNGEEVLISSKAGMLMAKVKIEKKQRPDTVSIDSGTWIKYGGGVNILTEDILSHKGEGACYYETSVFIKKIVQK